MEADDVSDIDLAVIVGSAFEPTDVFCLAEDLHRVTQKEVDVHELCEIDQQSDFYRTILREGGAHRRMRYSDLQRVDKMCATM